ncbi:hypothetical protein BDV25DRAFT_41102 [Aspergillus avenaceus]|uniref:Glycosyl hydrolase family 61-domain-containing protein n=1 Tax=Aspergillus avenaceus TaxID=36643 RepID=A0A5N6TL08_ASPAV|nr:hypothetical protein BDV25DRAFT_41102 [Aspergillus avenaceus]
MLSKVFTAALIGASAVQAHMVISQPVPYSQSSLNNSPLEADGSDFPCKLRGDTYTVTTENTAAIGEAMPLTFTGSATHGGGSCQVAITKDRKPTKDTKWMVIKSIEGGCPANVDGNMAGGPSATGASKFTYKIPQGVEEGQYTLAWTWFNRIGNREMYMNCAPLTVTGSKSKRDEVPELPQNKSSIDKRATSFPPLFVANVNGCLTKEGVDVRFPNPGDNVEYAGTASNLQAEGSQACTGTATFGADGISAGASGSSPSGASGSGSGSGSSATAGVSVSVGLPKPVASSTLVAQPSQSAGIFVPTQESGAKPTATANPQPAQPSASAGSSSGSSSSGSSGSSDSSSSNSSSSSGAQSGACSPEGLWNCIGGTSFQRCANGQWSAAQQMATGVECTAGQGQQLNMKAAAVKPRMLHEMRHRKRAIAHHA